MVVRDQALNEYSHTGTVVYERTVRVHVRYSSMTDHNNVRMRAEMVMIGVGDLDFYVIIV